MTVEPLRDPIAQENRAGIARVTCGWKKAHLPLELVRRYWRDVHSPGISRRPGLWEYRHLQYDPVRTDVIAGVDGIVQDCPADQQLMWTSDVRYLDQAGVALFNGEPSPEVKTQLLGDIDLIVDQSTTYLVVGDNARTLVDATGPDEPQGPSAHPTFAVFCRQRGSEAAFRAGMRRLAARWAAAPGVLRVRLALFDVPDMEAERRAGYPIKTHPVERQYQAWIDLSVAAVADARALLELEDAAYIHTMHVYPVPVVYTSVRGGALTLVGLRGWPAFDAMKGMDAVNQREPALLQWMYGHFASRALE
jgi:hypothetical protein